MLPVTLGFLNFIFILQLVIDIYMIRCRNCLCVLPGIFKISGKTRKNLLI